MDQAKIKKLLRSVSFDNCSRAQLDDVLDELLSAIPLPSTNGTRNGGHSSGRQKEPQADGRWGERDRLIVKTLFEEAVKINSRQLMHLFPLFALLCGDREGRPLAQVNLDLVERPKS